MSKKMKKIINLIVMILGGIIMFTLAVISIIDSHATDLVSVIPSSIAGATLFLSGYIGFNINDSDH